MDAEQRSVVEAFREFMHEVVLNVRESTTVRTPLGELVAHHLGTAVESLPLLTEDIPQHRLVDADIALELLAQADNPHQPVRVVGCTGGQQRFHEGLPQLLSSQHQSYAPAPVDYFAADTGPDTQRQVVGFGLRLLSFHGEPAVALQRAARRENGRESATLEVLTGSLELSSALLAAVRTMMVEHSVMRGKVLSFSGNEYGAGVGSITFLDRPTVPAEAIVLSPGTLEAITSHVVDVGLLRQRLRADGQHLKRGILLYGPPGTGKTLTIRHLLSRSENVTSVLLAGNSIRFITAAAELARAMQPAIVVLEDVDLIASERDHFGGPQPLLFAVLDALDGLDADADVAFVLSTNRADLLEPALAQRPGRVDLAVEIPLPDRDARRRLFALYAGPLPLTDDAVSRAADRADGVTGSFAKELMRRTVLRAAQEDRAVTDDDLAAALEDLLASNARVTRTLLGAVGDAVVR